MLDVAVTEKRYTGGIVQVYLIRGIKKQNAGCDNLTDIISDMKLCTGCAACVQACSRHAVLMKKNHEGFSYPEINELKCIDCGLCRKICPVNTAINQNIPQNTGNMPENIKVYACYSKDDHIREKSSSGGVFSLLVRGMPFSIAAGVGFIALFGVAVLNGLVWVSDAENHRKMGVDARKSALEAANDRLRPVLMTAMVASLGFLPMALSTSDGAEIQRPLAIMLFINSPNL